MLTMTLTLPEVVSRRVKEARGRRGWTQEQLAERLRETGWPADVWLVRDVEQGVRRRYPVELWRVFSVALDIEGIELINPAVDEEMTLLGHTVRHDDIKIIFWYGWQAWLEGIDEDQEGVRRVGGVG